MPFLIPDKGTAQNDIQSILFQTYWDVLVAGINGVDCVLSGGAVTAQGSPNMTVAVAKAAVLTNGVLKAVAAGTGTITTADATNPRLDLVVITSSGAIAVRAGTAAAAPKPPARTANDVVLAVVFVPANDTTISSDQIVDLRVLRTVGPILIDKVTAAVTFNTSLAAQTYLSTTIPNGLFLSGRKIRVRCGGNYLANSGTPTWTFAISYGATTIFADVTGATTADTDRGAWVLDFTINASANATQTLAGLLSFQTPGSKTAATNGLGDLSVTTHVTTPIRGTAAIDSDAGDNALAVKATMSVSNAADETVLEFATVEIL